MGRVCSRPTVQKWRKCYCVTVSVTWQADVTEVHATFSVTPGWPHHWYCRAVHSLTSPHLCGTVLFSPQTFTTSSVGYLVFFLLSFPLPCLKDPMSEGSWETEQPLGGICLQGRGEGGGGWRRSGWSQELCFHLFSWIIIYIQTIVQVLSV